MRWAGILSLSFWNDLKVFIWLSNTLCTSYVTFHTIVNHLAFHNRFSTEIGCAGLVANLLDRMRRDGWHWGVGWAWLAVSGVAGWGWWRWGGIGRGAQMGWAVPLIPHALNIYFVSTPLALRHPTLPTCSCY